MSKPKKQLTVKNLSGLGGVYDVSFGDAPPERRAKGIYSKEAIPDPDSGTFSDYQERQERWKRELLESPLGPAPAWPFHVGK